MTTQVLTSSGAPLSEVVNDNQPLLKCDPQIPETAANGLSSKTDKLPYQADHQAQLLNLQAEIEALLQQLKALSQQKISEELSAEGSSEEVLSETPMLVAR